MASSRPTKTNRVFIDSSVLIAAAISRSGSARDLLLRGLRGQFDIYISSWVLEESERNLSLKAPEALAYFYTFRDLLAAKLIDPPRSLVLAASKTVPLKDAPVVAAAVEASARYLVTYDQRHLLSKKEVIETNFNVMVVTPDEVFQQEVRSQ